MRRPPGFHLTRLGVVIALSVLFAGCADEAPVRPSFEPEPPRGHATFPSRAAALDAAVTSYRDYLSALDQVASSGGEDATPLAGLVTERFAEELSESAQRLAEQGLRLVGESAFDQARIHTLWEEKSGVALTLFVCLDASGTRLLNQNGDDVTPADRSERTPTRVTFRSDPLLPTRLLPDGSDIWPGERTC